MLLNTTNIRLWVMEHLEFLQAIEKVMQLRVEMEIQRTAFPHRLLSA